MQNENRKQTVIPADMILLYLKRTFPIIGNSTEPHVSAAQ